MSAVAVAGEEDPAISIVDHRRRDFRAEFRSPEAWFYRLLRHDRPRGGNGDIRYHYALVAVDAVFRSARSIMSFTAR